jgi:hypothetical protein
MKRRSSLLVVISLLFFVACTVVAQKGIYRGTSRSSWVHSIPSGYGGMNYFDTSTKPPFPASITVDTSARGSIYVSIFCVAPDFPIFSSQEVTVEFENGKKRIVKASDKMDIQELVSDTFRLTVPSFRIRGLDFPQLVADFKWSDETKHLVRGGN